MEYDIIIRGGSVVDGTGVPARRADVAVRGDRVVAVDERVEGTAARVVDAEGRIVTPGFVDVRGGVDADLFADAGGVDGWHHGVTSVVVDDCSIDLAVVDAAPKGCNIGGLVSHDALRRMAMGERADDGSPTTADDRAAMIDALDAAIRSGVLGLRTGAMTPCGAATEEVLALAEQLRRHGVTIVVSGDPDGAVEDPVSVSAGLAWMSELSRRTGRPVTFPLAAPGGIPDGHARVVECVTRENASGAHLRPHTAVQRVDAVFGLDTATIFDGCASWASLRSMRNGKKMVAIRDPAFRVKLIDEAERVHPTVDPAQVFVVAAGDRARYDHASATSLAAEAQRRGISAAACYIELLLETDGQAVCAAPLPDDHRGVIEELLDDPQVVLGRTDSVAHSGHLLTRSQPTFFLSHWVLERGRWSLEEGIRRLTSDPADLFGLVGRGRLQPGSVADVNVIDPAALHLPPPQVVRDGPGGAARYVQGAAGYDLTLVNGQVFMEEGRRSGVSAGRLLTPAAAA